MRKGYFVRCDRFDFANTPMDVRGRTLHRACCRRLAHPADRSLQARLRIDQELPGDNDLLSRLQALPDLGLTIALDSQLDLNGSKSPIACGHYHDIAFAGGNDRLGGNQQHVVSQRL